MSTNNENVFFMAGTEGTGEYVVVAASQRGRVGYRLLGDGSVRVRVEPAAECVDEMAEVFEGWKQPSEEQCRFSMVAYGPIEAVEAVMLGVKEVSRHPAFVVGNPAAVSWAETFEAVLQPSEPDSEEVDDEIDDGLEISQSELISVAHQAQLLADSLRAMSLGE